MSKSVFNIVRPREDPEGKTFWDRHGVLVVDEGKISIRLQSIPTGTWNGWLNVFPRDEPNSRSAGQGFVPNRGKAHEPAQSDFDDDLPF